MSEALAPIRVNLTSWQLFFSCGECFLYDTIHAYLRCLVDSFSKDTIMFLFVSHAEEDDAIVDQILSKLSENGITYWADHEVLKVSDNWRDEIEKALLFCRAGLFIVSKSSLSSRECKREYRKIDTDNKPLFYVIIDETPFSQLPPILGEKQGLSLYRNFSAGLEKLIKDIKDSPEYKEFTKNNKPSNYEASRDYQNSDTISTPTRPSRSSPPYNYPPLTGDSFEGYTIKKELNGGRTSITYIAENKEGKKVIIKIARLDTQEYKIQESEQWLQKIGGNVKTELLAWERLRNAEISEIIADVYAAGSTYFTITDYNEVLSIPFIVQQYIQGRPLEEWCIAHYGNGNHTFSGITDENVWFEIAKKLTQRIGLVHEQRVVHGDIWPPNIMMQEKENGAEIDPVLIDFGQAWFVERDFFVLSAGDPSYPYYAPERTVDGGIWREPADIFSLGGVFYYLATGQKPPMVYKNGKHESQAEKDLKNHAELKRELRDNIRHINPALYSGNPGIVDIILYCMRPNVEDRAAHAEAVSDVIDLFETAFESPNIPYDNGSSIDEKLEDLLQKLHECNQALQATDSHPFHRMLSREIRVLRTHLQSVQTRVHNLTGDRETYINSLLACISSLKKDDRCLALTTPTFWRQNNFGNNGRLLTMLKMAAWHGGVRIRWVLLITDHEFEVEEVNDILQAQADMLSELEQEGVDITDRTMDGEGCFIGYVRVSDKERRDIVRGAKTFVLINRKRDNGERYTLIAPTYTKGEGRVTLVRFWNDPHRLSEFRTNLEAFLGRAISLLDRQ